MPGRPSIRPAAELLSRSAKTRNRIDHRKLPLRIGFEFFRQNHRGLDEGVTVMKIAEQLRVNADALDCISFIKRGFRHDLIAENFHLARNGWLKRELD